MQAIILAAGMSTRLGDLTKETPKCLLKVGGKEILGRQIEALIKNKINDVTIIVGFESQQIINYCKNNYTFLNFTFIKNEAYQTTNNGYSLSLGINNYNPFILLNADTIVHPDMIKELVQDTRQDVMLVKYKDKVIDEDMKVFFYKDNRIEEISKTLVHENNFSYEFTGVAKFSTYTTIRNLNNELIKEEHRNSWFEVSLNKILEENPVYALETTIPTLEIDFPADLEEANDLFHWGDPEWELGIRHESLKNESRNLKDANKLLFDMINALEANGIKYWLNWGCLLGVFRDKSLIPWDTDIDVTIHKEDEEKLIKYVFPIMKNTYHCHVIDPAICFEGDFWFIRDKEKIELNTVHSIGNKYVYSPGRCDLACPKEYIDKLDTVIYEGKEVKIPSNTAEYLRLSYGNNWNVPIKGKKPVSL